MFPSKYFCKLNILKTFSLVNLTKYIEKDNIVMDFAPYNFGLTDLYNIECILAI